MIVRTLRILIFAAIVLSGLRAAIFILRRAESAILVQYGVNEESRRRAVELAPDSPLAVTALGKYLLYRAEPASPEESIASLQRAVTISPHDYRFWLELGRAYENTGLIGRAETALGRALDLAPRYFETRWALANFELRTGRIDRALADFKQSIEISGGSSGRIDQRVAQNVFTAVSGALGNNLEALSRVAPPDSVSQSALAEFLIRNGALDQALSLWRRIPAGDPPSFRALTILLLRELQSHGRFGDAKQVWRGLEAHLRPSDRAVRQDPDGNLMYNPGFEDDPLDKAAPELLEPPAGFDWILRRHTEAICRRETSIRNRGAYALHLQFPATMQSDFDGAWQLTALLPGRRYRLTWFVKTRYVSRSPNEVPYVEISDATRPELFLLRSLAPQGTNEWSEQSIIFSVPAVTTGLQIRLCAPRLKTIDRTRITELWYDDFSLEPLPDDAGLG